VQDWSALSHSLSHSHSISLSLSPSPSLSPPHHSLQGTSPQLRPGTSPAATSYVPLATSSSPDSMWPPSGPGSQQDVRPPPVVSRLRWSIGHVAPKRLAPPQERPALARATPGGPQTSVAARMQGRRGLAAGDTSQQRPGPPVKEGG
jgi:hypothetical protein